MKAILSTLLVLLTIQPSSAQDATKPRPSPMATTFARYKDSYLRIVYSQPQKKGREVFGSLVPFGQVWRTGANEATEITVTRDIKINGNDLKAGTYALFTIPDKNNWTIILNSDLGQWGSYNYNAKMDVLRFTVTPAETPLFEAFTITIDQKNDKAGINMIWERTKVTIPIQFSEPKL